MKPKASSRQTALALVAGAGLGLTPVLLAAQGSAFAAPDGFTGTPLCSQSVDGRNSGAFGWWDRNLCFEYTTTLVGPADSGAGTWEFSVALTPITGDLDFYDESAYVPEDPFTPLTFVLRSAGGITPTSATATAGVASAPSGTDVTVTLTDPVATTITVIGTVPDGTEDVFGFGFAAGDGTTCATEWSEWVNNSTSAETSAEITSAEALDSADIADELLGHSTVEPIEPLEGGLADEEIVVEADASVADEIAETDAQSPTLELAAAATPRGTWTLLAGPSSELCNSAEFMPEETPETPEPKPLPEAPGALAKPISGPPAAAPQVLAQTGSSDDSAGFWSILGLGAVAAGVFTFARSHTMRRCG